mmetsp:Transcript_24704/g.55745  ORF Transcript_24704/g.55745 Transcript_24704/m.55745 type:complete len:190 (+) Transcript_24704:56-625(+)
MAWDSSRPERRPPPPWVTHDHEPTSLIVPGPRPRVDKDGDPIGIFYVDETPKVEPKKEQFVFIEVRCETQPEEAVGISGSDWQLGKWDPRQSWYLNTSPETYPVWRDRIPMPSAGGQFKAFIKNTVGEFVWEPLSCNRTWPKSGLAPETEVRLTYGESGISTLSVGRAKEKKEEIKEVREAKSRSSEVA